MKRKNIVITLIVTLALMTSSLTTTFAATGEVPVKKVDFPTAVTLNIGESKELAVTVSPGNTTYLTNIAWGFQSNGHISHVVNGYGTYWGKPSSEVITGLSAGTAYLNTTVKVYNSNKQYVDQYSFRTVVTVTDKVTSPAETTPAKDIGNKNTNSGSQQSANTPNTGSPANANNNSKNTGNTTQSSKPVTIPMTAIKLNKNTLSLNEGKTATLTVSFQPTNTTDSKSVTWTSSDKSVATVSNGVVKGCGDGTATITAKCGKYSVTCRVHVTGKDGYVTASTAYKKLNTFRTKKGVWQWNKNNKSKTYFNTKKSNTLKALKKDSALEKTARLRAKEAAQKFSHTRPNGKDCFTAFPKNIKYRGENLAGYISEGDLIEVWMEEGAKYSGQGHRRNMLNKNFTVVGIAGYRKNGRTYWAMCLGKK